MQLVQSGVELVYILKSGVELVYILKYFLGLPSNL